MGISDEWADVWLEEPELEEEFKLLGSELGRMYDTEAAHKMYDLAEAHGRELTIELAKTWLAETVTFWQRVVEDITGRRIDYDLRTRRWRDVETGRFVSDPYVVIRTAEEPFEDALRKRYGR